MQAKRINKNSKIAWKQQITMINDEISQRKAKLFLKNEKKQKGIDRDSHNRKYIASKIKQYILEGMQEEKAVERVIQEEKEIVKQFEYLTKNGLDIRRVFANWASNFNYEIIDKPFSNEDDGR